MRNLKITTSQLARICGVSQGTVDRALNNRKGISEQTKQRIINTAIGYGYRPTETIGKSAEEKIKQIGIIVFNLNNEYFSKLIMDIECVLREMGYAATVMFTHFNKQYEIDCIRKMYNMGVEGVILCSVNAGEEFANYLNSINMPVVAVGNDISCVPYVGVDDFSEMRNITENVLMQGYDEIIYFSPAIKYSDAYAQKRRFEGFIRAMQKRTYSVITDIDEISEFYNENTAIICSNDYYALKVYFKTKGARIIGFDNIDILEKYKFPISSVSYSTMEIAQNAIDILLNNKKEDKIVGTKFIVRQ